MRRTQFQTKKQDVKFENINKVKFRDQQHLDLWNSYIEQLHLPCKIDIISLWKMENIENELAVCVGYVLKQWNPKLKRYICILKETIKDKSLQIYDMIMDEFDALE